MPKLSLMFKTVSSHCNLTCAYCYYRKPKGSERVGPFIPLDMLEKFIPEYMAYTGPANGASFGWQGGEPTLAGLDFFKSVVEIQKRHGAPGMVVSNDIQTNGILLDDEWASFFSDYRFLVGVSLDGPENLHDVFRIGHNGRGSFSKAMTGISALKKRACDLNILCVVGNHNVHFADRILEFFRQEEFPYIQFMPVMNFQATDPGTSPDFLIGASEWGDFLKHAFDVWYGDGYPRFSIRTFDSFLQSYLHLESRLCIHGTHCDSGLIIETTGDVYPCDFYIHPRYRIGKIPQNTIDEILENERRVAFVNQKQTLPMACQSCPWRPICNGGCPRNWKTGRQDILCSGYQALFEYADGRFRDLAERMLRKTRTTMKLKKMHLEGHPQPGRNDPCPCGSGSKIKRCCENPSLLQSYVFQD